MPKLLERQAPLPEPPAETFGLDALLLDGDDLGEANRKRVRAANAARQAAESGHPVASEMLVDGRRLWVFGG